MKNFKKIMALTLSASLVVAQSSFVSAFAAEAENPLETVLSTLNPSKNVTEPQEVSAAEGEPSPSAEAAVVGEESSPASEDAVSSLPESTEEPGIIDNSQQLVSKEQEPPTAEVNMASSSQLKPSFDFESYDWSDPAEKLNAEAEQKLAGWQSKYSSSKDYFKRMVDRGVFPTDETFFGVWNGSEFENEPMLNYDYDSYYGYTLVEVLNAVKNVDEIDGKRDYSEAKEKLLEYYRKVAKKRGIETPSVTNSTTLMSDLLTQNFHVNSGWGLTAMFSMSQNESDISIDVKETVEKYRNGTGSLIIHAVHKDDYEAEFYSREAGKDRYKPYIEATVGGSTVTIPVVADGYTSGGKNVNVTSGGTDVRLYARESGREVAADGHLTDDNTRRTYLLFNFSNYIKPGDTITSATLKLRGKVNDKADMPRNNPSYQKLMMIANNSTTWTESNISFSNGELKTYAYSMDSDGRMETAYWGMPNELDYPNVRQDQELLRFGTWWDVLAKQFYATGNEDYARTAMLYLHDFIKSTYNIERGEQGTPGRWSGAQNNAKNGGLLFGGYSVTLDASSRASAIAKNFQYLYDSEYLTPELFTTFLKYFKSMGDRLAETDNVGIWGSSENGGNWGTAQINGHFAILANFPEIAPADNSWIDKLNEHLNRATYNMLHKIEIGQPYDEEYITDGSSHELSHSYTSYGIGTQLGLKTMAEEAHINYQIPDNIAKRILLMTKYMMNMAGPGGTDPQYGDAGSYTRDYISERFEFVGDWLDDPELQWMASGGAIDGRGSKGKKPDYTSYYYPIGKTLAMRTGFAKDDMYLHTTADAADGTHSHWDDGGIIVSAYGNYLLSDQGYNGYLQDNIPHRWLISSRGHNTVEINDYNQNSKTPNTMDTSLSNQGGKMGEFQRVDFNDKYDFTKMDLTSVYKDLEYHYKKNSKDVRLNPGIAPGWFVKDEVTGELKPGPDNSVPKEPGMQFQRNILFVKPNFWIVSDYMNPFDKTKVNKYSQYWHMIPSANISIDGQYQLQPGETVDWSHSTFDQIDKQIENTEFMPGTGTGAFKSNFVGKANIQVVPADISSVEPKLCYGYYENSGSTPYGRFDKNVQGTTGFDTILFPTKAGEVYSVNPTPLEVSGFNTEDHQGAASAFTANIKAEKSSTNEEYDFNYFILHETDKKDEGADMYFADYSTDGELAYYEKSSDLVPRRLILQNGTHLSSTGIEYDLVRTTAETPAESLSVEWTGSTVNIEVGGTRNNDGETVNPDFDVEAFLNTLTVYAPSRLNVKKVTVNGESKTFKQTKDFIYFHDGDIDPPFVPDPIIPTPKPTSKPSGGGSHGTGGGGGGGNYQPSIPTPAPTAAPTAAPENQFEKELSGHWAEQELRSLIDAGIVKGDNGTLNLTQDVSRAEFLVMMMRALGISETKYLDSFQDVSGSDWYAGYIQAAYDAEILEGDGLRAMPEEKLTREQAVKIMLKALETKMTVVYVNDPLNFTDASSVSDWAVSYMSTAVSMGLINGLDDGSLQPQSHTLREQAMVMVYRALQKTEFVGPTPQEPQASAEPSVSPNPEE